MVNVSCSENRTTVIKRAMLACEKSGHHIDDDFADVSKMVIRVMR